ncbi:MAG: leucine-rich repeat domain-containing protein [Lachnospiraceae bacterium]|nr:leucine-rich repeat domain-containing protein [Lachnospiraceae bacterium]MCM1238622.1 leucine-rich repeat domain-containing protein [Lachnospiraceae bacterium]
MRKRKRLSGILLIIAALIIMQLPVSEADAASSSASDFKIESGVLVKYRGTETNVSIPDTVEVIGEGAFEDNTRVELVVVPNSVRRIESYAFWGCDNLDTVVLGKGLTEVGDLAFAGCGGLEQMTIPSNILSIGVSAFADCVNLRDVSIPPETTSIHESAFDGCYRLTIHCQPGTVADKFAQEFYERQKEMPEYQDVPEYPDGDHAGDSTATPTPAPDNDADIPSTTPVPGNVLGSTQIVGNRAVFFIDSKLPEVMSSLEGLPSTGEVFGPVGSLAQAASEGVSKYTVIDNRIIADQAYYRDGGLGEVQIPAGISELGQFSYARSSITDVTIPLGTKVISYGAFYHCDSLKRVSLPDSITLVEPKAFSYTPWLKDFLDGAAVEGNESGDEDYLISGGVLVAYRGTEAQAVIPDGVRVIAAEAFRDHTELESVIIPDSVTVIGEGAFEGCGNLTALTLGSQVQQVKDRAFDGCGLQQVMLPESVTEVGIRAFGDTEVSFAGEAFEIPNSYETTATRLSNEDYRNLTGEPGEAGVTVVGMEHAYAELEGAARSYTLAVTHIDDISALEQACIRSFNTSVPENMAAYDLTLIDSSAVPITKLGHQILTVVLPVPENLSGQRLQVLTLDRNGQPELLEAERGMMDGVESVRFQTNHLSPFGIYGLGADDTQAELQELSVELTSQSGGPGVGKSGSAAFASKMVVSGLALALGVLLIVAGTVRRSR